LICRMDAAFRLDHETAMSVQPAIYGPEPISLEGRTGVRYWVHYPFTFTGTPTVDERLSGYPLVVFQPQGRPSRHTPVVLALQGMAAPWQWNAFIVPTLLDMGIACVLFDVPVGGERSLTRSNTGDALQEVTALLDTGATLEASFMPRLMEAVTRDIHLALALLEERHGLTDPRRALFGVSLGTLLTAFAFMRDGVGQRLLGTIGHADLRQFARSYTPRVTPLLCSSPVRPLVKLLGWLTRARAIDGGIAFLGVLHELCGGGEYCRNADPMAYCERVGPSRRVRFLVGQADPLVRAEDAVACAGHFRDGECYVVPGLGHGGDAFVGHVRTFLGTQLGDWKW
jgi:hypothetical protein